MAAETSPNPVERITKAVTGIHEKLSDLTAKVDGVAEQNATLEKQFEELSKPQSPFRPQFSIRKGEDPLTSRPYSLLRVAKRLAMQAANTPGWEGVGKPEAELSRDLVKHYYGGSQYSGWGGHFVVPLGTDLMSVEERTTDEGDVLPGMPVELHKRCKDMMDWGEPADLDELAFLGLSKRNLMSIRKDMSANTATTGGTMVAEAAQGELINVLRAQEMWSQVGAEQLELPPQGSITFPRVTSTVTVAATTEGATVSESTPGTGQLRLTAKPYSSLVDVPEELLNFASVSVEAWLRNEMAQETVLKTDRDGINGAGGTAIQGAINYSGVRDQAPTTEGANGDTMHSEDPLLLFANIADQNAPVNRGFFLAMTNSLWARWISAHTDNAGFFFAVGRDLFGNSAPQTFGGNQLVTTTQIPTDRSKGTASTLTLVLGGVGAEWVIARSGVLDVQMTNSDASKFQTRLSTMRATQYVDMGPRHENSFGLVDTISNTTVTA